MFLELYVCVCVCVREKEREKERERESECTKFNIRVKDGILYLHRHLVVSRYCICAGIYT